MRQQITQTTIPGPAFLGLNKQRRSIPIAPAWCIEGQNCVFDAQGRLAARNGIIQTSNQSVASAPLESAFEYVQSGGSTFMMASKSTALYGGSALPLTDITGALVFTSGAWQYMNFNGNVYFVQQGEPLGQWTGTGNATVVTVNSGTQPDGNCGVAAFGRLWIADDDYQTIIYSALLDPTRWAAADGGGTIDMRNIWTNGTDQIVAMTSYQSSLVVFGKRHIVIWSDGLSDTGLEPDGMFVSQILENVGCIARDSVQRVGDIDVIFWSASGVRSLQRVLADKATPLNDISRNNHDFINNFVGATGMVPTARSVYSPKHGMYLLMPGTGTGRTLYFDTRMPLEDGSLRMLEWPGFTPTSMFARLDGDLWFGFTANTNGFGYLCKYGGYLDQVTQASSGVGYTMLWQSPWLDLGAPDNLKFLKELKLLMSAGAAATAVIKWFIDFNPNPTDQRVIQLAGADDVAQYGIAQFGIDQYGAVVAQNHVRRPLSGECQYVSVRLAVNISGAPVALQSLTLFARPGRLA